MERLIHNDYLRLLQLTNEEACNLFDAIHYYGRHSTLDAAEDMNLSVEPLPLVNHWANFDEFLNVWDIFSKMAKGYHRITFAKTIVDRKVPKHLEFSKSQLDILSNPDEFMKQACYLLSFFDSMSDYFDYEVEMLERGYPHSHRSVG